MSDDPTNILDDCRARLEACLETLDSLVASGEPFRATDMEAVRSVCDPTLAKCNALLADFERQKLGALSPMRISAYFDSGHLPGSPPPADFAELYEAAGRLLDADESHETLGRIIFLAENGKWYEMTTEAVITEIDKSHVDELRIEDDVVPVSAQ